MYIMNYERLTSFTHAQFFVILRDRPFNLKGGEGGLWFFVSFKNFFSDNTRVRIFFLSLKARIFFQEFNIRSHDKNSDADYFFPPPKSEYFFHQHWESEYYFRKKPYPPPPPPFQVKRSFTY